MFTASSYFLDNRYYFPSANETANSKLFMANQLNKCRVLFAEECEVSVVYYYNKTFILAFTVF